MVTRSWDDRLFRRTPAATGRQGRVSDDDLDAGTRLRVRGRARRRQQYSAGVARAPARKRATDVQGTMQR